MKLQRRGKVRRANNRNPFRTRQKREAEAKYQAWRASAEDQDYEERQRQAEVRRLEEIALLTEQFEKYKRSGAATHAKILTWLSVASDHAHTSDARLMMAMRDWLSEVGYEENMHVGLAREAYDNDPDVFAGYIVGQCMTFMKRGMPPHQVVGRFVDEWRAAQVAHTAKLEAERTNDGPIIYQGVTA